MRILIAGMIGAFGLLLLMGGSTSGETNLLTILLGVALMAAAVYVFRGKGAAASIDTWEAVQDKRREDANRRVEEQKAQRRKERTDFVATILGRAPVKTTADNDSLAAAQVNAIANPETAKAIQNLQNLLYTQAITEEEFQAAKNRLLRSSGARTEMDATAQITKLAELHEAGVLSDAEFNAAKLRALGLA